MALHKIPSPGILNATFEQTDHQNDNSFQALRGNLVNF